MQPCRAMCILVSLPSSETIFHLPAGACRWLSACKNSPSFHQPRVFPRVTAAPTYTQPPTHLTLAAGQSECCQLHCELEHRHRLQWVYAVRATFKRPTRFKRDTWLIGHYYMTLALDSACTSLRIFILCVTVGCTLATIMQWMLLIW